VGSARACARGRENGRPTGGRPGTALRDAQESTYGRVPSTSESGQLLPGAAEARHKKANSFAEYSNQRSLNGERAQRPGLGAAFAPFMSRDAQYAMSARGSAAAGKKFQLLPYPEREKRHRLDMHGNCNSPWAGQRRRHNLRLPGQAEYPWSVERRQCGLHSPPNIALVIS